MHLLRTVWDDLLGLLYPRICPLCGIPLQQGEAHLCINCLCNLPRTNSHRLPRGTSSIETPFAGYPAVHRVVAFLRFEQEGPAQRLIHQFKYHGDEQLAIYLGHQAAQELRAEGCFTDVDRLVPVPLHPRKMHQRGYNQSERIARGFASIYGIPIDTDTLVRRAYTETQTRKSAYDRHLNMENVFTTIHPEHLAGHHILLIDDVLTTGSTLLSCIDALHTVPDLRISLFTVATVLD